MIKSQEKVSRERHYIYLVLENIFKRSLHYYLSKMKVKEEVT